MHEDERDRLIAAAWSILERTGFAGLKVQRVTSAAGLSTRAFYRHFADKDDLLVVLVRDEMERAATRLTRTVANAGDPVAQVRAWVSAVIGAADDPVRVDRARLFTTLTPALRRHHDAIDEAQRALWKPLRDAIEAGRRSGDFPGADPESDALLVHELAGARLRSALDAGRSGSTADIVDRTVDFALRALRSGGTRFHA